MSTYEQDVLLHNLLNKPEVQALVRHVNGKPILKRNFEAFLSDEYDEDDQSDEDDEDDQSNKDNEDNELDELDEDDNDLDDADTILTVGELELVTLYKSHSGRQFGRMKLDVWTKIDMFRREYQHLLKIAGKPYSICTGYRALVKALRYSPQDF